MTIDITNITNNAGKVLVGPYPELVVPAGGTPICTPVVRYTSESSASKIRVYYSINGVSQGYKEFDAPPDCANCNFAVVPNVVGMTPDAATTELQSDGLVIAVTYNGNAGGTGLVVSQSPAATLQVAVGSSVTVVVDGVDPDALLSEDLDASLDSKTNGTAGEGGAPPADGSGSGAPPADGSESGTLPDDGSEGGTLPADGSEGGTPPADEGATVDADTASSSASSEG